MTRTGRLAALALPVLVIAACATANPPATPQPAEPPPAVEALTPAEQAFVDRIAAEVDPVFAEYPERYAGRGANTCKDLDRPASEATATGVERFSGGTITVTSEQAAQIVAAARDTLCADQANR